MNLYYIYTTNYVQMYTKFYLERPHGTTYHVRARVKVGDYYYTFYPGIHFHDDKVWDRRRQRMRSDTSINRWLDVMTLKIDDQIRQLMIDGRLSKYEVERFVLNFLGKKSTDMFSILSDIAAEKAHHSRKNDSLSAKYLNIITKMKAFSNKLGFDDINVDFVNRFAHFLFKEYNISTNTASRYITFLKTLLREAHERGYHSNESYRYRKFAVKMVPTKYPYLDTHEIERIYQHECHLDHLENMRLNMLIGCYTGQRHSDWRKINASSQRNINNATYYDIQQTKTKINVLIPSNHKLDEIVKRKPRPISNQKANIYIKEMLADVGIDSTFIKPTYKGNQLSNIVAKKHELGVTHMARRSFVCNSIIAGIPHELIMKVCGWSSYGSFRKYVQLSSTDGLEAFTGLFDT